VRAQPRGLDAALLKTTTLTVPSCSRAFRTSSRSRTSSGPTEFIGGLSNVANSIPDSTVVRLVSNARIASRKDERIAASRQCRAGDATVISM
jgi:hypothetical protein